MVHFSPSSRTLLDHFAGSSTLLRISPISSAHTSDVRQASQPPAERRPDPKAQTPPVQKSGAVSQDQVTLKSAGQADHEADGK